jgi:PmbA protein
VSSHDARVAHPPEALERFGAQAVEIARRAGAAEAEAVVETSRAFGVRVRGGSIETLKQSGTLGLGLRVIVDARVGFVSTNDLAPAALEDLAARAVALARHSSPDPANALATPADAAGEPPGELGLFDPAVPEFAPEAKIALALELERIALGHDPRIVRTEGAGVSSRDGAAAIVTSTGLTRSWSATSASLWVLPLADDRDGRQQTGHYGVTKRRVAELPAVETAAREAAARAVARIGARPVASARVPVVMHPDIAAGWIAEMHDAFSGEAALKRSSWLTERLGQPIAAPLVTLVDDGRLPGAVGTEPWDGEGVATRRNVLIDRGTCAMFLYDVYHARRAGTRPTGSAVRGYASLPGIGAQNLYLEPGAESPEAILARVDRGFYLDDTGSFGFNPVTGDYSFQAQGFWIEGGARAFPVDGVTVASNSLDMLRGVVAVGNDLEFRGAVASPTLLIAEMTLSGAGS